MTTNSTEFNSLSDYKLYFDDIEEIFLHSLSFKYLLISVIITCLLAFVNVILLIYRSTTIFLASLTPFIYSLIFYDCLQILSIILLKYNLIFINETYFSDFCRWPYYFKATSEAGQCLTLIFLYAIRCQKIQYFLKRKSLPRSTHIHSRVLTFVCLLFILYANNWITHLKVEKIHLVTLNESNNEINIQEYPLPVYGMNEMKLNDRRRFYSDLDKYAQNYRQNSIRTTKPAKIIHNQKDDSLHEIIIKFPLNNLYTRKNRTSVKNQTQRKPLKKNRRIKNMTKKRNNTYRIHRCTYEQRNYILTNVWSLTHAIFYLIILTYYLTTIYRYRIPSIKATYHTKLLGQALTYGRRKSAEHHKQVIQLTHLKRFQYVIVFCHTVLLLIRLIYVCLLTLILFFFHSPFKWLTMKYFFQSIFVLIYYSIPLRMFIIFLYIFFSLFSSYIYSIFYYVFRTKLHFSCQLQRPTIRFSFHIAPYPQELILSQEEHSTNSMILDLTSSIYDEHSTVYPNESTVFCEESSSTQNVITTNNVSFVNNDYEQNQV